MNNFLLNLTHHKYFRLLVILLAGAIILTIIFKILTPQSQTIPTTTTNSQNFDGSASTINQITFSGELPTNFPSQLPVYSVTKNNVSDQIINSLTAAYNLQPIDQDHWRGEKNFLYHVLDENRLMFGVNDGNQSTSMLTSSEAIDVAKNFVSELSLPNLVPQPTQLTYFSGSHELTEVSAGKATVIKIPFSYSLTDLPVYFSQETSYPVSLMVNSDLEVSKAEILAWQFSFTPGNSYQLLTVNQVIKLLNNHQTQASIIAIERNEAGPLDLAQIDQAEFTQIQLEYRYDPDLQLAYPFYRLQGNLQPTNQSPLQAEVIVPAVKL